MSDEVARMLSNTTDARMWAWEFLDVIESGVDIDEALMVGWFANAIETGRAAGRREEHGRE